MTEDNIELMSLGTSDPQCETYRRGFNEGMKAAQRDALSNRETIKEGLTHFCVRLINVA